MRFSLDSGLKLPSLCAGFGAEMMYYLSVIGYIQVDILL